jgi:hypothetical protein
VIGFLIKYVKSTFGNSSNTMAIHRPATYEFYTAFPDDSKDTSN